MDDKKMANKTLAVKIDVAHFIHEDENGYKHIQIFAKANDGDIFEVLP